MDALLLNENQRIFNAKPGMDFVSNTRLAGLTSSPTIFQKIRQVLRVEARLHPLLEFRAGDAALFELPCGDQGNATDFAAGDDFEECVDPHLAVSLIRSAIAYRHHGCNTHIRLKLHYINQPKPKYLDVFAAEFRDRLNGDIEQKWDR